MKYQGIYQSVKSQFSIVMLSIAKGELILNKMIADTTHHLQMPVFLLYLPGILKILGVLIIWLSPFAWHKEWAYAGFTFYLFRVMYSYYVNGRHSFPDVILATACNTLCITTFILWKKTSILKKCNPIKQEISAYNLIY